METKERIRLKKITRQRKRKNESPSKNHSSLDSFRVRNIFERLARPVLECHNSATFFTTIL